MKSKGSHSYKACQTYIPKLEVKKALEPQLLVKPQIISMFKLTTYNARGVRKEPTIWRINFAILEPMSNRITLFPIKFSMHHHVVNTLEGKV